MSYAIRYRGFVFGQVAYGGPYNLVEILLGLADVGRLWRTGEIKAREA